ncbi:MAG: histidine kinase [Spirochaetaceae bacterium]|nr:histidine kinase [Spirochaetaceae bacterium]
MTLVFHVKHVKPWEEFDAILDQLNQSRDGVVDLLGRHHGRSDRMEKIIQIVDACCENATRLASNSQAAYAALQSQINPHFLYNTLDSVRAQAMIDGNMEIAKMIETLAGFFRYCIGREGELVTLREELANIENYMAIHHYRFGDRYSLEIDINNEDQKIYDLLIPRLILQPVLENAIYHGLADILESGKISVSITVIEPDLLIVVSDNGTGMDKENLLDVNERIHSAGAPGNIIDNQDTGSKGVALTNIEKRIRMLFGADYGISLYSTPGAGTDVEILIPAADERSRRYESFVSSS